MLVISAREFREKQSKYFDMASNGEDVVLKSRGKGSFKLVPVTEDDTLMSKEEFFAKIDKALDEARQGKGIKITSKKELEAYFDSL